MVPIIQFDPATLALVYDVELVSTHDPSQIIADAVGHMVGGDTPEAIKLIRDMPIDSTRDRAIHLISAFAHEKRHFLDFVLTNYGAFRFRQFLELYVNLPHILDAAKENGVLHAPLEIYNDPVRRKLADIDSVPSVISHTASRLSMRRKMIERDRQPVSSRIFTAEIGGEAQLEFPAFVTQQHFLQTFLGEDMLKRFFETLYDRKQFSEKYLSIFELANLAGVLPIDKVSDTAIKVNSVLLECIVFASLQTDYFTSHNPPAEFETSYPGERLSAILQDIVQSYPESKSGDLRTFGDCWNAVDAVCKRLFGFTVVEQIERDHKYFENWVNHSVVGNVPQPIETMCKDYIDLRQRMIQELKKNPAMLVSAEMFIFSLDRLEPNYVICASGGKIGEVPKGFDSLMSYQHPEYDAALSYRKWWWACTPGDELRAERRASWKFESTLPLLALSNPKAWYRTMDFLAPVSKLLMNGRRIRTIIGPELLFAQQRLSSQFQVEVKVFPSFEYPDESYAASAIYYYFNTDLLRCDLTSVDLQKPEGKLIGPWTLRRWPELGKYVIEKMGGNDVAYFCFVRDWSLWLVSDIAFEEIAGLMQSQASHELPASNDLTLLSRLRRFFYSLGGRG